MFSLTCQPETADLAENTLVGCDMHAYTLLASRSTAVVASLIALLPLPANLAIRMLRPALRAGSLPVGGFCIAEVKTQREARDVASRFEVRFDRNREYWMSAVVAATVARLIAEGQGVKSGVHFLAGAVDPVAFMKELHRAGGIYTRRWDSMGVESSIRKLQWAGSRDPSARPPVEPALS